MIACDCVRRRNYPVWPFFDGDGFFGDSLLHGLFFSFSSLSANFSFPLCFVYLIFLPWPSLRFVSIRFALILTTLLMALTHYFSLKAYNSEDSVFLYSKYVFPCYRFDLAKNDVLLSNEVTLWLYGLYAVASTSNTLPEIFCVLSCLRLFVCSFMLALLWGLAAAAVNRVSVGLTACSVMLILCFTFTRSLQLQIGNAFGKVARYVQASVLDKTLQVCLCFYLVSHFLFEIVCMCTLSLF